MLLPQEFCRLFPPTVSSAIQKEAAQKETIEEIRCRIGQPYTLLSGETEYRLGNTVVSATDLDYILERASNHSYHTVVQELAAGFVHTTGGCRIGVCGALHESGVQQISSVSIRIPHEIVGCADKIMGRLQQNGFRSTLLVSPPGAGKTTLLRDVIRSLSQNGRRVSVADERGEIAAVFQRTPQFDLGPRTDVMTGGSKKEACMMLLRAMNPQVLAFDEITSEEDIAAAMYASGCGVALLATAHASGAAALRDRALYRQLLDRQIFRRAVEIQVLRGERHYKVVDLSCV